MLTRYSDARLPTAHGEFRMVVYRTGSPGGAGASALGVEHEMAALKEGDGFTERPLEPALIDELKNINTFPIPDQTTKNEVEEELKKFTPED